MQKWLGITLILTLALFVQACAPKSQEDCGFVQNVYGERISWKREAPVTMQLHAAIPDSMIPAILKAAESWNATAGRRLFNVVTSPRYSGPINPHQDGNNVIYIMDNWEDNRGSEQGRTSVYWVGDQIKEADIRLNGRDFSFYEEARTLHIAKKRSPAPNVSLEALVLHEMGHVLGLKHKDGVGSVMATELAAGDDRITVAAKDRLDLQCEY